MSDAHVFICFNCTNVNYYTLPTILNNIKDFLKQLQKYLLNI